MEIKHWSALKKWHQLSIMVTGIGGVLYILFTTFRAGVSYPLKQEYRFQTIERGQMAISNKVEELVYKSDRQHDLLIRIEERLWPRRKAVAGSVSHKAVEDIE